MDTFVKKSSVDINPTPGTYVNGTKLQRLALVKQFIEIMTHLLQEQTQSCVLKASFNKKIPIRPLTNSRVDRIIFE